MSKKIGIIDLGSNSVRLVIFEILPSGTFRLVDDIKETIRLSENMIDGRLLNDIAMHKAVKPSNYTGNCAIHTAYPAIAKKSTPLARLIPKANSP